MCQLEMKTFLENAFITLSPYISAVANKIRAVKCKLASFTYNSNSTVILDLPIQCSINDIFDGELDNCMFDETEDIDDLVTTEYKQFILTGVDPEIYYFFRYYDSQSSELFHELCTYWGYQPKSIYIMQDQDSNIIALYTNTDEIYGKYCDKLN